MTEHLIVYGRAYCHLCDDMIAAVVALQPVHGFTLEVVDVDADPALEARYDERVPVLVHDGVEICHHVLDAERLMHVLEAAKRATIC
jgi:hypothetical protein